MNEIFDWVTITAGEFWMGTDLSIDRVAAEFPWARRMEIPQHSVYLIEKEDTNAKTLSLEVTREQQIQDILSNNKPCRVGNVF
jgi:hypothetical protein